MVALYPVVIEDMTTLDIDAVQVVERASFPVPWPANAFRHELTQNKNAHYIVAKEGDRIVGYAGLWLSLDEAHITTFAVHPRWRRRGVGQRLLLRLLELANDRRAREATLEVRLSNMPARRLYEKYGFRPVGIRPRYYSDNGEDALIMTTDALASAGMRERLARLRDAVDDLPIDPDDLGELDPDAERYRG
jgi:ribosomal-protein-alanine N-acetyltransferase